MECLETFMEEDRNSSINSQHYPFLFVIALKLTWLHCMCQAYQNNTSTIDMEVSLMSMTTTNEMKKNEDTVCKNGPQ